MTLGEKIKKARLERHMTQREVVGDYITRNMLSKIENNSATPSMKTLEFLASQLGLPTGYFVSEEAVEVVPQVLQRARQAYTDGDAAQALELLEGLESNPTDESQLLQALCHLRLAEAAGRVNHAERALYHASAARDANACTAYRSDVVEAGAALLEARFNPEQYESAMGRFRQADARLGLTRLYHLTMAQRYLALEQTQQTAEELSHLNSPTDLQSSDYLCLQGALSMKGKDYQEAAEQLRRAESLAITVGSSEEALSPLYAMLEECYREMGDYKEAYHYASKQIQR